MSAIVRAIGRVRREDEAIRRRAEMVLSALALLDEGIRLAVVEVAAAEDELRRLARILAPRPPAERLAREICPALINNGGEAG